MNRVSPPPPSRAGGRIACLPFLFLALALIGPAAVAAQDYSTDNPTPVRSTGNLVSLDQERIIFNPEPPEQVLAVFSFDNGPSCDSMGWTSFDLGGTGFGDYAALQQALTLVQEDPCQSNFSCSWAFINGSTDNYACGGFPAQASVPFGGTQGYIRNGIESPAIALSGNQSGLQIRFLVYRDLPLDNLVFYRVRVLSIKGGSAQPWRSRREVFYGGQKDHLIERLSIGDLIEPGADSIRVAFDVIDMCETWCGVLGEGNCHSHAPLFDDVELVHAGVNGPQFHADPIDLFQDSFAGDGTITGTVRVDIARDINPRSNPAIRPGDSLTVSVNEATSGLDYNQTGVPSSGPAVYLHIKDIGAKSGAAITGDPARWPVVTAAGGWTVLRMDSIRTGSSASDAVDARGPGRYCVDLDDALYTPGDTIVFYLSARDASGRTSFWSEVAGIWDNEQDVRDAPSEMTCLPASGPANGGDILFIDDADGSGAEGYFDRAFTLLGIKNQVDRYDVRGADRLAGNGPGSRVTNVATQLQGSYRKIIWSSGSLAAGTIGDGAGSPDKSPDADMLAEFLRTVSEPASGVYIVGDNVAGELAGLAGPGAVALKGYIDYSVVARNHGDLGAGISPVCIGVDGGMFDSSLGEDTLVAYGGCPTIRRFDVLDPQGTVALPEMQYDNVDLPSAATVSQRTTNDTGNEVGVVLSGFGFGTIRQYGPSMPPTAAEHLRDILVWLNNVPTVVCPPVVLDLEQVGDDVTLEWNDPGDPQCGDYTGYRVYRRGQVDTARVFILQAPVPAQGNTFIDDDPLAGEQNTYEVMGVDAADRERSHTGGAIFVNGVTLFSATPKTNGIDIRWTVHPKAEIDGFFLARADAGAGNWAKVHDDDVLAGDVRGWLDRTVLPGQTYDYHLDANYTGRGALGGGNATVTALEVQVTLQQNFPNPFNPTTRIPFTIPAASRVTIRIYDVGGRRVATVLDETVSTPGYHEVIWNGTLDSGAPAGSGVYFYFMETQGFTESRKLVLVR